MLPFVLSLPDPNATLEAVGGKGRSLARLARAGLPVPDGFHITTAAYREFVAASGLQPHILKMLGPVDVAIPATPEAASQAIGRLFALAPVPEEIERAICADYEILGARPSLLSPKGTPVAVRSSATAEDLPGASFAGQQETYLNIRGAFQLMRYFPFFAKVVRIVHYRLGE